MKYRIINYRHFGECLWLSNGTIEIVAALSFGIRILRLCICGEDNLFYEQPEEADYLCTEKGWRVYGGHRLWIAPEREETYWPDNGKVTHTLLKNGVLLDQSPDGYLNVKKSICIRFIDNPYDVEITHFVKNLAIQPLKCGLWAVSAVQSGGIAEIPFSGVCGGYAPQRFLSLWGDTSLADERIHFTEEAVFVKHLPLDGYFKIGLLNCNGLARYKACNQEFTKQCSFNGNVPYPDNNVNFEVYTCRYMMEIETLSPLTTITPGDTAEHAERWHILRL